MNTPLISVVTVVYNDVAHIEKTILSVLEQTYPFIEYIVIDGGSRDGTAEIIGKYAHRLAYWCSEPDGGVYDAMNKGLRKTHGKWVNFMNSGDFFHDENVLLNMDFGKIEQPDTIIYGDINCHHWDGVYHEKPHEFFDTRMKFKGVGICHQSMFFPGERIRAMQYDVRYKISADYALTYDMWHQGVSFLKKDLIVADYSWGGISAGLQKRYKVYVENARICGQTFNPFF